MDGQFLKGFSTGGKTFGYRSQPVDDPSGRTDPWGNPVPIGYRLTVVPEEAAVVREIFRLFQEGWGEKAIAKRLNGQHPGRTWRPNTIYFMLKNPKYTGSFSFNRREWRKNPETGRRVYRLRPEEHWETLAIEDLRIVDERTWLSVARRLSNRRHLFANSPRVIYLLSGFLICDRCNGHFTIVSNDHYGCRNHSESSACDNDLRVRRDAMESLVIGKLATCLEVHKAAICEAAVRRELSEAEPPSPVEPTLAALRRQAAAVMHAVRESRLGGRALDEAMATYQAIWSQIEAAERAAAAAADRKPAEVHYDVTVIEDFLTHLPDVLRSDIVLGREFLADVLSAVRVAGGGKRSLSCPVCGRKVGKITPRHMALHGLSLAETYRQFPEVGFNKKARLTFQPGLQTPLLGSEVYTEVAGGGFEPPTFGL
jgi:site-specific DNA recombinase